MPEGLLYLTNTKTLDDSDGTRAPVESSGSQTQRATLITRGWRAGQVTPTFPSVSPTSTPQGAPPLKAEPQQQLSRVPAGEFCL
ncbi:hypothetical protein NDU88_000275 [Pleurodeles waltl]|uniref:Uncharacterized protein n=1 Tax=Pleurodeles waltl TaxID=8319 RepID=A0AAV7USX0_PLEWA|nr:hypothetical protein NDU88_000275 [Pleurodeles waltl]